MANYYASARSNYFKVKDEESFRAEMGKFGDIEVWPGKDGTFAVAPTLGDGNGWPGYRLVVDENGNEDWEDVDFTEALAPHLEDGWVAILMEAGAEKLRYISGYACAVNNKGETRQVVLSDIYVMAQELGENVTGAEY